MKKIIIAIIAAGLVGGTAMADILASWTFVGATPIPSQVANSYDTNLDDSGSFLDLTRGAGAPTSAGSSSFRTTGFRNDGISTANTDYFQVILKAASGYELSLSGVSAIFGGTSTYSAGAGASMQWAYSTDGGSTFSLIDSPVAKVGVSTAALAFDFSGEAGLQGLGDTTSVMLRMYATGQTTSGGWGFISPSAGGGVPGFEIEGSLAVVPEPSVFALLAIGGLAAARFARRRKS